MNMEKNITKSTLSGDIHDSRKEPKKLQQEEKDIANEESDVSPEEKELLEQSATSMSSEDDETLAGATLDNTDEDGEPLNEQSDLSGNDLDIPGAEYDDAEEETGGEDEENNSYSLGADKDD